MDHHLIREILAVATALLFLAAIALLIPPGTVPDPDDQEERHPAVWEVLEEARRITEAAAEE
jgi:hypothetical protein